MTLAPDDPRHGKYASYANHACRCDLCRAAATAHHREWRARGKPRSDRARSVAMNKAIKWLRESMPDVWDGFMAEAYDELGIERRPVGRPEGS